MAEGTEKRSPDPRFFQIRGRRLADLRNANSFTQKQVGEAIGIDSRNVSRIEQSEVTGVFRKRVPDLAKLFGMSPAELMSKIGAENAVDSSIVVPTNLAERIQAVAERRKISVPDVFELMLDALEHPIKGSSSKTPKVPKPTPRQPHVQEQQQGSAPGGKK